MLGTRKYWDREHAGRQLARALRRVPMAQPVVVALSPESVLVARQVSDRLGCDLDALMVIDVVDTEEPHAVIGAVAEGGVSVLDRMACQGVRIDSPMIDAAIHRGLTEASRRAWVVRSGRSIVEVDNRMVVLVEDGIDTGLRMSAAISTFRRAGATRIIASAPIGKRSAIESLQAVADEVICPIVMSDHHGRQHWYEQPESVSDSDIASIVRMAARHEVEIDVADPHGRGWRVHATLAVPRGARGVVIFAHGSGSSRWSPRNHEVATALNEAGFATILFDLLTEEEANERGLVFDIGYLAERLIAVVDWCARDERLRTIPIGLFGASTGAAAALVAAARRPDLVRAVVSRGGRPDLAGTTLSEVDAPTLLIVGGDDQEVLRLNDHASTLIAGMVRLEVVPGATHLFEEPGALERVSLLAASWFDEFFSAAERVSGSLIRYRRTS